MNNWSTRLSIYFKKNPVTASLVSINTLMFLAVFIMGGFDSENLTRFGGLKPILVLENNEYHRLIVAMFLHGGLIHFLFNTYFLHYFGSFTENLLGKAKYIIIYFASGLGSSLLVLWLGDPNTVTIGASGALFGILGGLLVLTYVKTSWFHPMTIKNIRTIAVINIIFTFLMPNISRLGHIGGFVSGAILIYFLTPDKPPLRESFTKKKTRENPNVINHDDISEDDIFYH